MIHHVKHGSAAIPGGDYRPPRPGRLVVPWALHPKATRGAAIVPSDLTPFVPCIYDQGQIGECSACGTAGGIQTSLKRAGVPLPGILAPLPIYRATRALERGADHPDGTLPPLADTGAMPDDAFHAINWFGGQTTQDECGEVGPSSTLTAYEEAHCNDEPTIDEFEHSARFKVAGAYDIVSTGDQRANDVAGALAAGFDVGGSVYAADDRFQSYVGGVMPPAPAGAMCDHWVHIVGCFIDAKGQPIFVWANSWGLGWGTSYGALPGGCFLTTSAQVIDADCLIVYSVAVQS